MNGIVAYGSYLPYFRLDRKAIGDALAGGGGKGSRTVASYDEDTTSMGVEAARAALRGAPRLAPAAIYFATADPAYLDKTNATAIHAALSLDDSAMAFDMVGSIRSGAGVLRAAIDAGRPTLAVISDIRTGLPGGGDERDGGDAAVAFLLAAGDAQTPVLAEHVASASASAEFLERWRIPGDRRLAAVGGALRRARLCAAGGRRDHERAEAGRRHRRRSRRTDRGRAARPREQARAGRGGREARGGRGRPHRHRGQYWRRARGAAARRRARPRQRR